MKNPILFSLTLSIFLCINTLNAQEDDPIINYEKIHIGPDREITSPEELFANAYEKDYINLHVIIDEGNYFQEDEITVRGSNIIIEGKGKVNFFCKKAISNVMWIMGNNIRVSNIGMSHLNPGKPQNQNCTGRVIAFDNATNIIIENCDLNGCGLAGLHDNLGNENILIRNNYIHNNSLGAYTDIDGGVWQEEIEDHPVFTFENNRIENNGPNRVLEQYEIDIPETHKK